MYTDITDARRVSSNGRFCAGAYSSPPETTIPSTRRKKRNEAAKWHMNARKANVSLPGIGTAGSVVVRHYVKEKVDTIRRRVLRPVVPGAQGFRYSTPRFFGLFRSKDSLNRQDIISVTYWGHIVHPRGLHSTRCISINSLATPLRHEH